MRGINGLLILLLAALWLSGVGAGFVSLGQFESTEGARASPPPDWPVAAALERAPDRSTLLVFAHPHCPCTLATIEELNRLLAHCADRVRTVVLFYSDRSLGEDWARSLSYSAANQIPDVTVVEDALGSMAGVFRVQTSGQVCLYDPSGCLVFAGGITPARGHAGDNDGSVALEALILGGGGPSSAPVFGCSLLGLSETQP